MCSVMWWKGGSHVLSASQSRAHLLLCWVHRLSSSEKILIEACWRYSTDRGLRSNTVKLFTLFDLKPNSTAKTVKRHCNSRNRSARKKMKMNANERRTEVVQSTIKIQQLTFQKAKKKERERLSAFRQSHSGI